MKGRSTREDDNFSLRHRVTWLNQGPTQSEDCWAEGCSTIIKNFKIGRAEQGQGLSNHRTLCDCESPPAMTPFALEYVMFQVPATPRFEQTESH